MLISKNWLQKFVDLPKNLTPQELSEKLTLSSVEVEGVKDLAGGLKGVIVAEILEVRKHPNADKLQLAKVNDGKKILDIVCGAPNIAAGQKVPLATVGTYLPAIDLTIAEREVRGEKSQGMLCAPDELGLGSDHSGILVLDQKAKIGQPLAEVLDINDWVIEIDNKAVNHRPDMWGHYGIAREAAAIFKTKFKEYKLQAFKSTAKEKLAVEVKDGACLRYMAVEIAGIKVEESPEWLKRQLLAVGQKSINNIVDITNFVMYELGQPMHAFDADQVADQELIVRKAKSGEKILTLDGEEYELSKDDLVIADKKKILAIAGVMGGKESGISQDTSKIILEAANFDHVSVRKTSQHLALRSESSARFEKSLDPNLPDLALARAIELLMEVCPQAKLVTKIDDQKKFKLNQGPIKTTFEYIQKRIGHAIPEKEIVRILNSLGFETAAKGGALSVKVPTWRATKDVSADFDLVEEVARMYGFNNIPAVLPTAKIVRAPFDPLKALIDQTKDILAYGFEMAEVYNYSFVSEETIKKFGEDLEKHYILVLNPQAKGLDLLRHGLLHNLIETAQENSRFFPAFNIFEVGTVFHKEKKGEPVDAAAKEFLPLQETYASGLIYERANNQPFYIAKNTVDILMHRLHFKANLSAAVPRINWLDSQRYLDIMIGDRGFGYVAELGAEIRKKLGIKERVAIFEVNLSLLSEIYNDRREYSPIPKFPSIEMDISMIIDQGVLWQEILDQIKNVNLSLVRNVELFDIYSGEGIADGKKSVAFRVTYRSDEKTLETAEAEALHKKIKEVLKDKLGATIRE